MRSAPTASASCGVPADRVALTKLSNGRNGMLHRSEFTPSRRLMISALAHSGRLEEARDAVRALLKVQPNANVALVRTIAWQHPWMVALVVDGLRRAGLPE